jgi:hypothetical protein
MSQIKLDELKALMNDGRRRYVPVWVAVVAVGSTGVAGFLLGVLL